MNIEREETGTLTATIKLKLDPTDYAPAVDKVLKEQRKTAAWPGFRPGQVPMSIVKKRIGKSVLVNEVERLIDVNLRNYIQENKMRVLGQPLPRTDEAKANDWDQPGEFNFLYEVGMAPSFDVEMSEKLGVEMPVVDVDDALLDKEIADMRRRYGSLSDAEMAGATDMVIGDLIEQDENGEIKPGGLMNRTTITLEELADEATRALFTGKAVGDALQVDPQKVSKDHDDLAKMLGTDHSAVHYLQGNMLFRIAEIKRLEPAEIGPALFDRVFGQGAVADETAFRAKVKEGLEGMFSRDSERVFKRLVMRKLAEDAKIELPDNFLKRWISATSEKPITPEELESGYEGYAEGLRKQLLEDRIVEKYGLEAKGEELNEFAKRYVADQFAQYGMPAPEGDKLQEMAGRMLGEQEQIKKMRDAIVDQKLTAHFKAMLSPKENRLAFDDFVNLARKA
ncbi:MAG: trigger factor [Flavobacteriales bacterium]|jgi:trigger factor|nr:trigger factor [Flavobacteriales bacterium]MBK6892501.1 trigger factor [Flavobacteriales bacterium]MBK7246639.1 trigger factor [Flavobacteriales bacterium]MBK9597674.1 trigger factor [Flavobacteriales bacterium]QQS72315.1 MAG: trigger factor [Flavobacteriales bacterium]